MVESYWGEPEQKMNERCDIIFYIIEGIVFVALGVINRNKSKGEVFLVI